MTKMTRILFPALLAVALMGLPVLPASAQGGACLSKRDIQEAVSTGEILPLADILSYAGVDNSQQVLSVQVCEDRGGLVYVIGVLSPSGDARNLILDASTGAQY